MNFPVQIKVPEITRVPQLDSLKNKVNSIRKDPQFSFRKDPNTNVIRNICRQCETMVKGWRAQEIDVSNIFLGIFKGRAEQQQKRVKNNYQEFLKFRDESLNKQISELRNEFQKIIKMFENIQSCIHNFILDHDHIFFHKLQIKNEESMEIIQSELNKFNETILSHSYYINYIFFPNEQLGELSANAYEEKFIQRITEIVKNKKEMEAVVLLTQRLARSVDEKFIEFLSNLNDEETQFTGLVDKFKMNYQQSQQFIMPVAENKIISQSKIKFGSHQVPLEGYKEDLQENKSIIYINNHNYDNNNDNKNGASPSTQYKDIIAWIDSNNELYNQADIRKLEQAFELSETHAFCTFDEFDHFLNTKKRTVQESHQQVIIQQNLFLSQRISNTIQSLDKLNDDEDLYKSTVSHLKVCKELKKNVSELPPVKVYLILSGKMAINHIDVLPKEVKGVGIYCLNTEEYSEKFREKENVVIIDSQIDNIIQKFRQIIYQHTVIYNCHIDKLKDVFKNTNPILYLSISNYCASSVEQKSKEEIIQILKKIRQCYMGTNIMKQLTDEKIEKFANLIHQAFVSENEIMKLYTQNYLYLFFNCLLNYFNLNILESGAYIIKTIRYAISNFQDKSSINFQQPDFKLYRGLKKVDVSQFQADYPVDSIFVSFAFSSASYKQEIARQYADNGLLLEISFNIVDQYLFDKCRPKNISQQSQFPGEGEYLFNCFSQFQVKGYRQERKYTVAELVFIEHVIE